MTTEEIQIILGINLKTLGEGLSQASSKIATWSKGMASSVSEIFGGELSGLIGGYFSIEGVRRIAEFAENIKRTAEISGASTDFVQAFGRAVVATGGDTEKANQALDKLAGFIGEAANGVKAAQTKFAEAGISIYDMSGNVEDAEAILRKLSDKMADSKTATDATALAMEIWGNRIGEELVPALNGGSKALDKFNEKAHFTNTEITQLASAKSDAVDFFTTVEVLAGKFGLAVDHVTTGLAEMVALLGHGVMPWSQKWKDVSEGMDEANLPEDQQYRAQNKAEYDAAHGVVPMVNPQDQMDALHRSIEEANRQTEESKKQFDKELEEKVKAWESDKRRTSETETLKDEYNRLQRRANLDKEKMASEGSLYPTIDELANERNPFQQVARNILAANRDQLMSRAYGMKDRAEGDRQFANNATNYLRGQGVLAPELSMQAIQDNTEDTAAHLKLILAKANADGIPVKAITGQ